MDTAGRLRQETKERTIYKEATGEFNFRLMRRGLNSHRLSSVTMTHEEKEHLGKLAMGVFIEASNHGKTFQEAMLSVYLTGLENGVEVFKSGASK